MILLCLWILLFILKHVCLSVPAQVHPAHLTMFLCRVEHYGLQETAVTTNGPLINTDNITVGLLPLMKPEGMETSDFNY